MMTDTNDGGAQPQAESAAAPGMHILGQYIKDLSFETRMRRAPWHRATSRSSISTSTSVPSRSVTTSLKSC